MIFFFTKNISFPYYRRKNIYIGESLIQRKVIYILLKCAKSDKIVYGGEEKPRKKKERLIRLTLFCLPKHRSQLLSRSNFSRELNEVVTRGDRVTGGSRFMTKFAVFDTREAYEKFACLAYRVSV